MNRMLLSSLALLALSFAVGSWRARHSTRRLIALAWQLPAILLLLAVLAIAKAIVEAPAGSDNVDLAVIVIGMLGVAAAVISLCGGLAGGWLARR